MKNKLIILTLLTFISITQCNAKINKDKAIAYCKKMGYGTAAIFTGLAALDSAKKIQQKYSAANPINTLFSSADYDKTASQYLKLTGSVAFIAITTHLTYLLLKKAIVTGNEEFFQKN